MLSKQDTDIETACNYLDELQLQVEELKSTGKKINKQQKFLEIAESHFDSIEDTYLDFTLKHKLWHGLKDWIIMSEKWLQTQFNNIDSETINN